MFWFWFTLIFTIIIVVGVKDHRNEQKKIALMTPERRRRYLEEKQNRLIEANKKWEDIDKSNKYGNVNAELICPHCQAKGKVRVKPIIVKKGISGAKATGAILTGGVSLLATGLSRKEANTQAYCDKCKSTWHF